MKCWNCQSTLELLLICDRCELPQAVTMLGPFEALGLAPRLRTPEVEVRAAHERLARRCHPDLFRAHRDDRVLSAASAAMRALNDAYRTIRDPFHRLTYVVVASGYSPESTRTVPEGLQESVQIIERVLGAVEECRRRADRAAWEAEQDHLAALQVKVEKAQERSEVALRALLAEWDEAVERANGGWPEMPEDWMKRVVTWAGERSYLDSMESRMREGRRWLLDSPAGVAVPR